MNPAVRRRVMDLLAQALPPICADDAETYIARQIAALPTDHDAALGLNLQTAPESVLRELRDVVQQRLVAEAAREQSIIVRAQSLFNILSVYSLMAAAITALNASGTAPWLLIGVLFAGALWQVTSAINNILRATRGIATVDIGTSDLVTWATSCSTPTLYRHQIPAMIAIYRARSLGGTWRFQCLLMAQRCFRNLVILSIAILLLQLVSRPDTEMLGRFLFV